ncbi:hypothetical protein [Cetobacterium somerae]|uniref:hypothetical protein n=1 Tax=Cetobacterium somerae TaxID=188913 RepID=UPI00248D546D|nr:hypothetical protein [Cetobacterium somerae]
MVSKQKELIKLRNSLNAELNTTKTDITNSEQTLRKLKQKRSRLEARIAKVNGEIIKSNNGGKEVPIYLCKSKGMV